MNVRFVGGLSVFACCMVAACGGSEELGPGDGENPGGVGIFLDSGTSFTFDASFDDEAGYGVVDAGVDADGGRRHRDGGVGGFDGGFSFDGGFFDGGFVSDGGTTVVDAGTTPPPPPPDRDGGPQGPRDAGALSGPLLHDANGVVLGEIVSIQSEGAVYTIVTSNDYVVDINFDGTFPNQAFAFSGSNCSGTPYLSTGVPSELLGNTVYYSTSIGSYLIPAGPLTDGAEESIPISWASQGDPCSNDTGTDFYGWPLVETTAANVGLPNVIAAPLSYP